MYANYHTHTTLCHHAQGDEREYIENAIGAGIKILGFADHSPQIFDGGFVSGIRMLPEESYGYVEKLRRLGDEYKNDIQILVGFEAEYFPSIFDRLREHCRKLGVDYLIMGQHFLINEDHGIYTGSPSPSEERLTLYVDQVIEGMETGSYTYVAHPDLCNFTGDAAFYRQEMTRLCRRARELSVPLEINMLGYGDRRHYPCERFFSIAKEVGNDIVIGCDAHFPSALADTELQNKTFEYARSYGFEPLTAVNLRKI